MNLGPIFDFCVEDLDGHGQRQAQRDRPLGPGNSNESLPKQQQPAFHPILLCQNTLQAEASQQLTP